MQWIEKRKAKVWSNLSQNKSRWNLIFLGALPQIFNPVVETAIEKGAASILMPISSRRQLNDCLTDWRRGPARKIQKHLALLFSW
jgi:hypothetical protein